MSSNPIFQKSGSKFTASRAEAKALAPGLVLEAKGQNLAQARRTIRKEALEMMSRLMQNLRKNNMKVGEKIHDSKKRLL